MRARRLAVVREQHRERTADREPGGREDRGDQRAAGRRRSRSRRATRGPARAARSPRRRAPPRAHAHDTPRARRRHRPPSASAPAALHASRPNSTNDTAYSVPPAASVNRWISASSTHRNAAPSAGRDGGRAHERARVAARARDQHDHEHERAGEHPQPTRLGERGRDEALRVLEEVRAVVVDRRQVVAAGGAELRRIEQLRGALRRIAGPHSSSAGSTSRRSATSSGIGEVPHDDQVAIRGPGPRIAEHGDAVERALARHADRASSASSTVSSWRYALPGSLWMSTSAPRRRQVRAGTAATASTV